MGWDDVAIVVNLLRARRGVCSRPVRGRREADFETLLEDLVWRSDCFKSSTARGVTRANELPANPDGQLDA